MNARVDRCDEAPNLRSSSCLDQLLRRLPAEAWQGLLLEPMSSALDRAETWFD